MTNTKWIINMAVQSVLKLADDDAEIAQSIANELASLDWQQVLHARHQEKINSQMRAMRDFYEWRERGGGFCDDCEQIKYEGDYHHGPMYEHAYSWPHAFYPEFYTDNNMSGKRYCWKCFRKMQTEAEMMLRSGPRRHPHPNNHMVKCEICNRLFPDRAGYQFGYTSYCLHCVECAIEKQFSQCQGCDRKTASIINGYCYDCYPISQQLGATVSSHLSRATKAGTPATLTMLQWRDTLKHFNEKCAYCQSRPYQVLEHFLPIIQGGGTTADNCVPSCQKCNSKKGSAHPDTFNMIFPKHTIDRIKTYLQGNKAESEPTIISGRELVVIAK